MRYLALFLLTTALLPPAKAIAEASDSIDEITVYSTLDNSTLNNFSASLSLWDAEDIANRNAQHLDQLALTTPNLNFSGGASRGRFAQIRGIGDIEQFVDPKAYPSVGLIVDGIELNGLFGAGLLFDADQVEVLRGPQGTRFGASALAGAINIVSTAADDQSNNYVEAGLGRFMSRQLGGAYSANLNDSVHARVSIQQYRSDGYIENQFLNRDNTGEFDELIARTKFILQPTDNNKTELTLIHIDNDNGYDAFSLDNTPNKTISDEPGFDKQRVSAISLDNIYSFSNSSKLELKLTSLQANTGYAFDEDWKSTGFCANLGGCPDDFNSFDSYFRDREDHTADVRLIVADIIVGLYYQESDTKLDRSRLGDGAFDFDSDYETARKAIYFNWEPSIRESLTASLGARFEDFSDDYTDVLSNTTQSDDNLWAAEASITYDLDDTRQLYWLVSRGNKAGGVNTDASSNIGAATAPIQAELSSRLRFQSESLTNIELGFNSSSPTNNTSARTTIFYNKRSNPQFETFLLDFPPPNGFLFIGYLDNADVAESAGIEWEGSWQPNSRLAFDASLSYIDSSIRGFRVFDFDAFGFVDVDRKDQPRAPRYQYHLGGTFNLNENLSIGLQWEGRDDYEYAYYFNERSENVNLFHLNVNYSYQQVDLNFWMRNVFGEEYATQGLYFANDPRNGFFENALYEQTGESRNIGVTMRLNLSK